jgi:hypothetical protein
LQFGDVAVWRVYNSGAAGSKASSIGATLVTVTRAKCRVHTAHCPHHTPPHQRDIPIHPSPNSLNFRAGQPFLFRNGKGQSLGPGGPAPRAFPLVLPLCQLRHGPDRPDAGLGRTGVVRVPDRPGATACWSGPTRRFGGPRPSPLTRHSAALRPSVAASSCLHQHEPCTPPESPREIAPGPFLPCSLPTCTVESVVLPTQ